MTVSSLHTVFFSDDPSDYCSPVTGSVMDSVRGAGVVGWGPLSIHAYDMGLLADRLAAMADKARQVAEEIAAAQGDQS